MLKKIFSLSAYFLFPALLFAETPAGHFVAPAMPAALIDSFSDSVTNNLEWEVPESVAGLGYKPTPQESLLWSGSAIKVSVLQGDPVVEFSKPADAQSPANTFSLSLHFASRQFIIHSSAPSDPRFASGIVLPYSFKKPFRKFIPGEGDTGFIALVPRMKDSDWYAIAICPRNRVEEPKQRYFTPTAYVADSVLASVEGRMRANEITGNVSGAAFASILTSQNIKRSRPYQEDEKGENATFDIEYFEDKADDGANAKLPYSGIRLHGRLTAGHGERREKFTEAFTGVAPFEIKKPINFSQDKAPFSLNAGTCFAIFRGIITSEKYSAH